MRLHRTSNRDPTLVLVIPSWILTSTQRLVSSYSTRMSLGSPGLVRDGAWPRTQPSPYPSLAPICSVIGRMSSDHKGTWGIILGLHVRNPRFCPPGRLVVKCIMGRIARVLPAAIGNEKDGWAGLWAQLGWVGRMRWVPAWLPGWLVRWLVGWRFVQLAGRGGWAWLRARPSAIRH